MCSRRFLLIVVPLLAAASFAGCGASKLGLEGTVQVDGKPVYGGTIHFESFGDGPRVSAGGAIEEGKFQVLPKDGLRPGKYRITIVAVRKTGRKVTMPFRGELDEVEQIDVTEPTQEIDVTHDNAHALAIALKSAQ